MNRGDQTGDLKAKVPYINYNTITEQTLLELIKVIDPGFHFFGGAGSHKPTILEQSAIMKHCFKLRKFTNYHRRGNNDLPKLILEILDYKAEQYGISLSINYKSNKEYPVKCNSEEDLSMFLMYFQDFL